MSTPQTRSGDGGGRPKGKKAGGGVGDTNANKKSDVKTEKEKNHPKPTAEQIRIAQIVEIKNDVSDDPKIREKVANLMEMTQRPEEEVCCALNECDNDLERAAIFLLETLPVGAFETSSKKKKNRLTSATNDQSGGDGEWNNENLNSGQNGPNNNNNNDVRERSRSRGGMRGGRGGTDSRGWRGREQRENERNTSDSKDSNWRGGGGSRGGRGGRGGYSSRGGRGGRMGPRGTGPREYNRDRIPRQNDNHIPEVESWDNNQITPEINTWGDWDNEEYTGSLADSKVFTPSVSQSQSSATELSAPPGLEQQVLNPPSHPDDLVQQYSTTVVSSTTTAAAVAAANNAVQYPEIQSAAQHLRQALDLQQINSASSSLSAEQSQYFNSLTSQNAGQQNVVNVNSYQPASVQYSSQYGQANSYVEQVGSSQTQARKPPRARVPPPSKIPSTAVEMPGDTLNNIQYLDVQFGGLDFGTEESFDSLSEKFNQASLDQSQNVTQSPEIVTVVDYQSKPSVVQQSALVGNNNASGNVGSGVNVIQSSQMNDNLASSYSQRNNQQQANVSNSVGVNSMNSATSGLEQLSKNDHYNQTNVSSGTGGYQSVSSYNNNAVTVNKTPSYQPTQAPQGYTNSNYSNTQVSSNTNNYPQSSSAYSTYNPTSVNSYQQQNSTNNNNTNNVVNTAVNSVNSGNVGVSSNNNNSSQNLPVNNSTVNASSNSNSGYLSSQYPIASTTSVYPTQQGYQNNQSVYGTALSNNTGYSANSNASAGQYSNFNSTKLKETTPVSTPFESVSSNVSSSAPSSVSNSAVSTSSMSSPSLGLTNAKVTNTTAKSGGGVVQNIPMVSQYIQAGMPFYQQPVYSFEDIQMMQQRMPHVPGYYDVNYQTPTSLGAAGVRDGNLGSVAYSTMSDARFTRTDNNSSPVSNVPSTMSQQTGSGGPMLNIPYAYAFYGGMPGGFQYGTPAIYPQQMATASATSGGQFPKPSYNSGYGSSGYDAIGQTAQDYSKGGYPGAGVGQQSKGQAVSNPQPAGTGSDISSSMYGKSHVALNKVNSYDKQSFHSGTPPPFNLAGSQTAGATSAQAYGAQHLYIPTMAATHHSMNMHQQMHQMDGRIHNNNININPSRRDSSSTGQRQQSSGQGKTGTKQAYSPSYWAAQN